MLRKPHILPLFQTHLINSIKHEHSCKILYVYKGTAVYLYIVNNKILTLPTASKQQQQDQTHCSAIRVAAT